MLFERVAELVPRHPGRTKKAAPALSAKQPAGAPAGPGSAAGAGKPGGKGGKKKGRK